MDVREISIIYHVAVVIGLLWICASFNWCHPLLYFVSLIYLYQVHDQYIIRLRKKLQFEERKQAYQKRVLSDSETVRWLNHAVEKIWPICMEQITSQKILLPIVPWFLDKYKPWTAKEAVVQHMYLGRNPPMFTDMRVCRQSSDDDHLVLELGMNFLTADDMSAILAVKLRRRLGFGMWAKLHVTGMHIEGKVLVGVKFLREWPFLGRLRVCFVEPPYFSMTVKPIVSHGIDVTELPGIAGWLDKLLSVAFEQTLVEPNMLVVDMLKFASPSPESWFTVDEKDPIAYVRVEVIEGADMKPSDPNGLADPYVKGRLGPYRFRTKTQRKTLAPKWQEEFKIPICTWESQNILALEVRDKDHLYDDTLGDCSVNISDARDGQRRDMWIALKNIKMGRLHLAITVLDVNEKGGEYMCDDNKTDNKDIPNTNANGMGKDFSNSTASSKKDQKVADDFEPINIEGQQETGIWVHHPGSDVSQTWEPRKRTRQADIQIQREDNNSFNSHRSTASATSSSDENAEGSRSKSLGFRKSLKKIGSVFHRSPKSENSTVFGDPSPSPRHVNVRAENDKGTILNIVRDDDTAGVVKGSKAAECISPEGSEVMSPGKGNMKGMAKSILKHAEHGLKHVLSRKGSKLSKVDTACATEGLMESDSSDEESSRSSSFRNRQAASASDISVDSPRAYADGVKSPVPKEESDKIITSDPPRYEEPPPKTVSFETVESTTTPTPGEILPKEPLEATVNDKSVREVN